MGQRQADAHPRRIKTNALEKKKHEKLPPPGSEVKVRKHYLLYRQFGARSSPVENCKAAALCLFINTNIVHFSVFSDGLNVDYNYVAGNRHFMNIAHKYIYL